MVWDISDVWKRRVGVKNIASNIFYVFHHLSRCEAPQYKWMEILLQGRKADATNRSVGFSDSLNGIENYEAIFKYDIDLLKRRE